MNRRSFIRGLLASAAAAPFAAKAAWPVVRGLVPRYDNTFEGYTSYFRWDCSKAVAANWCYISRIREIDGELVVDTVPLEETWGERA